MMTEDRTDMSLFDGKDGKIPHRASIADQQQIDSQNSCSQSSLESPSPDNQDVSRFQSVLSGWLLLQKRMANALTPRALDDNEIGGIFLRQELTEEFSTELESRESFDLDGHYTSTICQLNLHEWEKSIRYNAVWSIIFCCEGTSQAELLLASHLKHLDIADT